MVAYDKQKPATFDDVIKTMNDRYDAWPVQQGTIDLLWRFTSRHQQFYVKLVGASAVVYAFAESIELGGE